MDNFITVGRVTLNKDEISVILPQPKNKHEILTRLAIIMKNGVAIDLNDDESAIVQSYIEKNVLRLKLGVV